MFYVVYTIRVPGTGYLRAENSDHRQSAAVYHSNSMDSSGCDLLGTDDEVPAKSSVERNHLFVAVALKKLRCIKIIEAFDFHYVICLLGHKNDRWFICCKVMN